MAKIIIEDEDGVLIQSFSSEELDEACDFALAHLDEIIAAEEERSIVEEFADLAPLFV